MKQAIHNIQLHPRQSGIALITVLVLMLLSLMAVLGSARVANLNEAMLGSTTDYNRARAAAEALMRDAQFDIRSRIAPAANAPWFPMSSEDFDSVNDIVAANSASQRCMNGICVPLDLTTHANIEDHLVDMTPLGASYGQFTQPATVPGVQGNPILSFNPARAWYWVELFRYTEAINSGGLVAANAIPDASKPFIYRITAVAQGLKAGTRVVLTAVYVPFPKSQVK